MLKTNRFYRTTQNHSLLQSDRTSPEPKEGAKVMAVIPLGSLVFLTKKARFRFVQVIYGEMVGYIWLYTNLGTMSLLEPIENEEDMKMESLAAVRHRKTRK
jgi:hypothetical protein